MDARLIRLLVGQLLIGAMLPSILLADTFTFRDEDGQTQTIEGLLAGSGQGVHAVELSDGRLQIVPQSALQERIAKTEPEPITPREMANRLTEEFGEDGIRTLVRDPYVVGLVLAGPLPARSESQVTGFLKKATVFLDRVDDVFSRFCRDMRIDATPPRYPLVMLIFETDRDFDAHATEASGGRGLSSKRILGFYSPLSNRLSLRIGECHSFQVPLHEAIHQQVFNRGLLQRLADVPTWFNEGIATGFENNGDRINIGPNKVNSTYAQHLRGQQTLAWGDIVTDDAAFHGDVLAGEAYAHAWGIHWMLVTQHRTEYARFIRTLGQLEPLQKHAADDRRRQFEETFGTTITELEAAFPRLLEAGIKRQRIRFDPEPRPGYSLTTGDASEVELMAVQRSHQQGLVEVQGQLRNISPFRDFAFYVTVQTDSGLYADWFLPSVGSLQTAPLPKQFVTKRLAGSPGGQGNAFWVEVISRLPDSDEVAAWKEGNYPTPAWKAR